jgi:hypothetical protein
VTTSVVVGSILLSVNDLLRVVQLAVSSRAHFVTDRGLEIDVNGTGDVLSRRCLAKKGVETVIRATDALVVGL